MKKILVVVLMLIMVFGLAGCVVRDETVEDPEVDFGNAPENEENNETPNGTEEETADNQAEDNAGEKEQSEPENDEEPAEENKQGEIKFAEITVVDNDQCTVKFTGIEEDNFWGYTITSYLENKSSDKTYTYSIRGAAVNGVQTEPFFATDVAPGKKSNEKITLSDDQLSDHGVEKFTDIEILFRVYDSNDWTADPLAEETVHVYPYGEDKAERFAREKQETDTVIVDNDSITVIVTDYEEDDIWGYSANLYLENKTDKELRFSVDEVSVNGFMADPFWATTVSPGKMYFSSISWSDSTFEENGITSVEEIEMLLRAYDANDWGADEIYNEVVKLTP